MSDDFWRAEFPSDGFISDVTDKRLRWKQRSLFFVNDDNGLNMAVNASASGATEAIHDGTDTALWAGSNITGSKVTFDSTDTPTVSNGTWPTDGTKSVKIANPSLNDVWQFDNGGADITVSTYDVLLCSINVDKDWTVGDSVSIFGYDTDLATQVGTAVFLEDYMNESDFDTIHLLSIPLVDMGLTSGTVDAIRMTQVGKSGPSGTWYMDELRFSESATLTYIAQPASGKIVRYEKLEFTVVDNITTLEPNKFMGLTLTGGLMFQRFENSVAGPAVNFTTLAEMQRFTFCVEGSELIQGATESSIKIRLDLPVPITLIESRGDRVEITLEDNFSGLQAMSAIIIGKELVE
jgi:hypothetical protein